MGRAAWQSVLTFILLAALAGCSGGGGGDDSRPQASNRAPNISGTPPDSTSAGIMFEFQPTATDSDGDSLSFSIENAPHWAMFDTATGLLSGTPFASHLGLYEGIRISVSDGSASASLATFSLTVTPQKLDETNFITVGDVYPTDSGYRSVGTLTVNTGEREQEMENSDLTLEFDDDGVLVDIHGETDLPGNLSDNVSVGGGVRSYLMMMTGAEINETPELGIRLVEDNDYFVYFLDVSVELTITNPGDPSILKVETLDVPLAGGQIVLISDPTDPMLYRYGELPVGTAGQGESYNRLFVYEPDFDFGGLDTFNGNMIKKGAIGFGIADVIELTTFEGYQVIDQFSYLDIVFDDALRSPLFYRAGMTGSMDFGIDVLGVGLFSFATADLNATLEVSEERAQAAFAFRYEQDPTSDVFVEPDWFHILPSGEIDASAFINATGDFSLELAGGLQSSLPPADLTGRVFIDNDSVTMAATFGESGDTLSASFEIGNYETVGRVEFPERYAESIMGSVSQALDRELAFVQQEIDRLVEATEDYEFEVSLRGVRESIPTMMDAAETLLDSIPGTIYTRAHDAAMNEMNSRCVLGYCVPDVVNAPSIARTIGNRARDNARTYVNGAIAVMQDLRTRALQADDASLREGLRAALAAVYSYRTYSRRIRLTYTINAWPFGEYTMTLYDETYTRSVLSSTNASRIATARDNVYRIQETSDIMISQQQIVDALPTEEIIAQVKQDVENGIAAVPIPEGLGYRAINDTYEAFVTVDGVDYDTGINVLDPTSVLEGSADIVADILLSND